MRRGAWNRDGREPAGRPVGRGPGVARLDARPHRSSMKISAKGEYALKAMLDLSMRESSGLVSIQEIAARQSIPQRYLEQVLLQLKRASLLTSKRGAAGGYHLTRSPGEITVGEVLRAVEGEVAPFEPARRPRRGRPRERPDRAVGRSLTGRLGGDRPEDVRGPRSAGGRASKRRPPHVSHLTTGPSRTRESTGTTG